MNDSQEMIRYLYTFVLNNGLKREFQVNLDRKTLNLINPEPQAVPEWAALENFQCPNCPLEKADHPHCPIAVNIAGLIDFFKSSFSYEEVDIYVDAEFRSYSKRSSLQEGISSILGLHMVTSGCPILEKLKPLVRYHLPFSSMVETSYRVISMYLLAQYFVYRKGKEPDWDLKKLLKIYDEIQIINKSFWERLSHIKIEDAPINALIILDVFATYVSFKIDHDKLSEIEMLCDAYFD